MKKNTLIMSLLLHALLFHQSYASQFQSITSIQEATREYIDTHLTISKHYELKLGQIDNRLKLPLCTKPLEVFTPKGTLRAGRNSIGVKCKSKKRWMIYTSATVLIYKDVLVLSQPVKRGDYFNSDNLQFERKEISTLRSGFFTRTDHVANKQARRHLNQGTVLSNSNITEPKLIKRGEKVTVNINSGNLSISVAGIALMDGKKNQNIKIKNLKSKKIVYATVVRQGQVVVTF